jgi:tetratricopeptide (TPR) repeat protein
LHDLGIARLRDGKLREALALLRAAVRLEPRVAEAHNNLGNALALSRRFDAALSSYRSAISLKSDFAEAHNNIANALMAKGRKDEAIAHYGTAVALRPGYAEAARNLANARKLAAKPIAAPVTESPGAALQRGGCSDKKKSKMFPVTLRCCAALEGARASERCSGLDSELGLR